MLVRPAAMSLLSASSSSPDPVPATIQFNRTPTKGINHAVMLITVTALLLVSVPAYAEMRLTSKDLTAGDLSGQTVAVVVAFE